MSKGLIKALRKVFIFTLLLLAGCSMLLSKQSIQVTYYSLDSIKSKTQTDSRLSTNDTSPTLIITMPKAAAGFDTRHMMYTRTTHQIEYFAQSEWVDTPAHVLQTLIVSAIEQTNSFTAVLPKQSSVKSDLRLESEIVRIIQVFYHKPSQVQFVLRATIINNMTNKVVAYREFDEQVNAVTDNAMGGVIAANQAVNTALEKLSLFSHEAAIAWGEANITNKKP